MPKGGWWLTVFVAAGCEPGNPCDEYVDYMCDCHPELDCNAFQTTYADPDPGVQDECAVLLNEKEQEDSDNGVECGTVTDTETPPPTE